MVCIQKKKTAKGNENKDRVQNLQDKTFYPKAAMMSWIDFMVQGHQNRQFTSIIECFFNS